MNEPVHVPRPLTGTYYFLDKVLAFFEFAFSGFTINSVFDFEAWTEDFPIIRLGSIFCLFEEFLDKAC